MQLGLETDANNPNFTGAHDPDAALFVRFFDKEMDNAFETEKQQRPIKYMATLVHIEKPGDINFVETFATTEHKKRFPKHWAHYLNTKNGASNAIAGTMLSDWQLITPAQASELRHFHFYTVEQVAAASDAQINAIGMIAGMAPFAFREKAKMFLRVASDTSLAQTQALELEAQRKANAEMAQKMEAMQGQMAQLLAAQAPKGGKVEKAII